uniref:ADP,ATP carrier protein n=1 Tax=Hanusia phi TaxID=3032 RepID=A0A7S0DUU5_9CRYP
MSSFATNPLDVVKTRIMLGQTPAQFPLRAMITIGRQEGIQALWSGFIPRLIWSATFFAVGISTYEIALANILKMIPSTSVQEPSCAHPQSADGRHGIALPNPSRIPGMIKRFYDDSVVSAQVMLTT